jgi:hypothetical protein
MRPMTIARRRRLMFPAAGVLLLAIPATAAALTAGLGSPPADAVQAASSSAQRVTVKHRTARTAAQRRCEKLFTVKMGQGAANLIYSGQGQVSKHALEVLGNIERCQRNPAAEAFVRGYDHDQARMHHARVVASPRDAAAQSSSRRSGGSAGWAIPGSVVQCESGGQNLPPNSAGASGYYQIIPSTWQAYGGAQYAPSAYQATAQQQAAVASRIWNGGAGAGQWDCAGRG